APVEVLEREGERAVGLGQRLHGLAARGDDFLADAVARDGRDAVCLHVPDSRRRQPPACCRALYPARCRAGRRASQSFFNFRLTVAGRSATPCWTRCTSHTLPITTAMPAICHPFRRSPSRPQPSITAVSGLRKPSEATTVGPSRARPRNHSAYVNAPPITARYAKPLRCASFRLGSAVSSHQANGASTRPPAT